MTEAEARGANDQGIAAALASAREQQAATREVLEAMSASGFDLKSVLQTIAENAVRLCRADNASVIRRDAATGYEIFASAGQFETGLDDYERYFAGRTFQPGRGSLTGRVLLARKTVQIDDMTADADYDPASAPVMRPQTLLGVPIMRGGEVEGLIIVRRHPVARFSAREIEILETFSRQAGIAMENVRLFSETKAALEQQTATAEVLKTISRSAFHLQSVFDVVVDNALSLCRGDFSYLYRRDGDVFRIVAARGGNKELLDYELANPTPITRHTLIGRVALDRQIVHIPDLFEDPEYDWPSNREQGVHTLLGVPALRDGDVVAVIGVARNERRPFSGEEIRLVEIFADQAAIAIENVRLFNETREALAQQTALSEVLNTISRSAFDLDTVLQTIVERAASLCDADGAAIHRRVGDVAIYAASYGDIGAVPGDTIPIDDGTVVGRAMLTGQRQYIPDARLQPDLPQEGPNTRLNIPFVRDGVAIGSLAVTRRVARPFSDSELRLFEVFADQAAIAIENVRLFNETKESLERQTALAEILRVIASSPSDDQPVFDTIAANATRYCGAEDALVLLVRGDGIVRVAHHGPRPIAEDPNIPLTREGVAGRAILERRTVHVADITAPEGDEYPWTRQRASVAGDRGVLATPLVRDGTAIGVIALRKLDTSGFTPSQIQLVEAFADQAVIAIENVRLFNETREALDRQSATAEVLKVMSDSPFELEPVLDSLVETAARLCNADHSAIFRREGDMLRMAATSKGRQSTLFEVFHARPLPLDRTTLTGRAVLDARTIHLPDVSADPDLVMLQERPEYLERTGGVAPDQVRRRSGLAVPLIRETEVIGAFALWRVTVSPFSTREIELIETFARQAVIAIENVRLFNETKEALERQTAISEILRAIANSPGDEKPVLATIAHSATLFCGAADAAILLIRDGQFKFAAHHGPVLLGGDSFSIPMTRESVAGHAAIELRTIQVADVLGPEGQAYPPARSGFEATGQRAILVTPLIRENQAIGAIVLRKTEAGAFSTSQVALVEAFADQAVIAIENVRLFNGTKEALEQQTAVSDVLKTISRSAFDLQPVLDIVLNNAVRLAGADIGWLARVEGEQFATVSYSTEFPQSVRDELFRARAQGHISPLVPLGKAGGLMGFTLAEGRTVHLPDVRDDPDLKHSVIVRATESRTVVGVPMLREGRSIGAMVLARFEVRPFGDRELELVQTFADQAAIAIENVRLFNETKEALERQTATAQVLRAISDSPTDVQPVLNSIAVSAARYCRAEDVVVALAAGGQLWLRAHTGVVPTDLSSWPINKSSLSGASAFEGRTLRIADIQAASDTYPLGAETARRTGHRATLSAPLLREGHVLGVLLLRRLTTEPFALREIELAETFAAQAAIAIENVRLFNETKESLERQTALAEILRVIADSPSDRQPVLDAVARNTTRYCGAEDAVVFLIDGNELRRVAHHGPIPIRNDRAPLDATGVSGHAVLERRTIHVADIESSEGDRYPTTRAYAAESGRRGSLAAPLLREGAPIGVILLRKMEPTGFSESQIRLVEAFADQAVIAIENVRLFNETKESLERQTAISDVLQTIGRSAFDLQPVLDTVVERAARLCEAHYGVISTLQGDVYRTMAYWGASTLPEGYVELMRNEVRRPERGSLIGRTALEGRIVHVPDVLEDRDYKATEMQRSAGYRTMLGVPLLRDGGVIGVFALTRNEVRPFTERQIELVRTFADQAAIAIENTRLFSATKEALEQQTAVSEVLKTISRSAFDLRPVLDIVLNNAVRLAGADIGWLSRVEGDHFTTIAYSSEFPQAVREELAQRAQSRTKAPWVPLGTGGGLMGFTLAEGRTVHLPDVTVDPDLKGSVIVRLTNTRTVVGVPMLREGQSIGGMVLARYEVRPFSEREVELVQTFADQAAIAIENVRLFNETKEALDRQTAVAEVLGEISQSGFELRAVLETAIEHATKLCAAQQGFIYRREGDVFRLAVAHGITPEFKAFTEANPVNPMGRGTVTGRVVEDRLTVHIPDVLNDPEYTYWEAQRLGNFRAILGVPMMRDDAVIGVMLLWRTEPQPFSEQEISLVTTFANQATIAIENVRLFDETKEALEQQSAISDVLKTISGTVFDLAPTLQTVVQNAAKLADADVAWMSQRYEGDAYTWGARYARTPELARAFEENFPDLDPKVTPGTGQGLMSRLYLERRTIALSDIEADPELLEQSRVAKVTGSRSVVGVPVVSEGNIVGAIVLARQEVRPFSEREVRVVETFADQAAIAIRNVRLFNEIQDKSRELEVASRHKSEFLANMSHELRTPLNAIIGFSEVLMQGLFGEVNEKQREYLQDVIGSGQHLLALINDILDLSKIEAGRMELELSTFPFRDALESGVTIVRERASRHNITISVVSDELGQVEADERKVKQIFYNLLSNAVKFTPDGGRVDVSVRRDNGDVRVEVRDNGIGIADADQARIFEEFQQVGRERSREGTGLGLTLTKRFVELHGGRIWLESAPGRGSTFAFTLPLRTPAPVRA